MRHHTIIARLGPGDTVPVAPTRADTHATEIHFVDGNHRPGCGLGQAIDHLGALGLRPSETAADLALLAAAVTAADTRISRTADAQDAWTREIDLHMPMQDAALWVGLAPLIAKTLDFLTGDRWGIHIRARPSAAPDLVSAPTKLRTVDPSSVCLFSGGLDSFIGAVDLLAAGQTPMLRQPLLGWDHKHAPGSLRAGSEEALPRHAPSPHPRSRRFPDRHGGRRRYRGHAAGAFLPVLRTRRDGGRRGRRRHGDPCPGERTNLAERSTRPFAPRSAQHAHDASFLHGSVRRVASGARAAHAPAQPVCFHDQGSDGRKDAPTRCSSAKWRRTQCPVHRPALVVTIRTRHSATRSIAVAAFPA